MNLFRCLLMIAVLVLAGCSGSSSEQADGESSTTSSSVAEEQAEVVEVDESAEPAAVADEAEVAEDSEAPPPVEAYDPDAESVSDVETDPTTAWISRRSMSADAIEVVWSAPEGAAEYQVHRVPRDGQTELDGSVMAADNLVFTGDANGTFTDAAVTSGELYWYGVRGLDADGNVLSAGWHEVAAVTDEQPPSPVELTVEQEDGSVLLTWSEPEENYQMHGYRILRASGDSEPEVVASTWDLNQRSFLDSEPPAGEVTYSVVAFDFHWNESEPAEVTLDVP